MEDRLRSRLVDIAVNTYADPLVTGEFVVRASKGRLNRDENPENHFCVYFAAFDPNNSVVFIGNHKKSGLWLFNGGHLDKRELPQDALKREAKEEWGDSGLVETVREPALLTITEIKQPTDITCRTHYDIWYFIPLDSGAFTPVESLLAKEFHQTGWKTIREAQELITDPNTVTALVKIKELFRNNI